MNETEFETDPKTEFAEFAEFERSEPEQFKQARTVPYDKEAEESVCGALIINPARLNAVKGLSVGDFRSKRCRRIFEIIPEYAAGSGSGSDFIRLRSIAEKHGVEDITGFSDYAMHLMDLVPSTDEGSVVHYAGIVREKARRRRNIALLEKAIQSLYDPAQPLRSTEDNVLDGIFGESGRGGLIPFDAAYDEYMADLRSRRDKGSGLCGISSGYEGLDSVTGGFEKSRLYVLGGRPAMGKTALALNIAAHMAEQGKRVAVFSLEMSKNEVMKRLISCAGGIFGERLRSAEISDAEIERTGLRERFGKRVYINDDPEQSPMSIMSDCIRENACGKHIDAVFIDHLGLLRSEGRRLDRRLEIGEFSRGCKLMSKKLDVPIVLLSQLSRANESRSDKMPILSDLRESGDIEQDADVVMFVHRPEYYKQTAENRGLAQINIAKNRDGETGTIEMLWDKSTTTFREPY